MHLSANRELPSPKKQYNKKKNELTWNLLTKYKIAN